MKTEHTPEPWFWSEKYGEVCFRSKEDDQSYGIACPVDLTEEANARRIVACVNACAGLPTEVLERYKLGVIGVDYKSTKQQRDELLAALERFMDSHEECTDFDGFTAQIVSMADYHQAQEAIESVKGEQ